MIVAAIGGRGRRSQRRWLQFSRWATQANLATPDRRRSPLPRPGTLRLSERFELFALPAADPRDALPDRQALLLGTSVPALASTGKTEKIGIHQWTKDQYAKR